MRLKSSKGRKRKKKQKNPDLQRGHSKALPCAARDKAKLELRASHYSGRTGRTTRSICSRRLIMATWPRPYGLPKKDCMAPALTLASDECWCETARRWAAAGTNAPANLMLK